MGAILTRATSRGTLAQVRHVAPVRPRAARGLVAQVYAQLARDFGMLAPPIILHSPSPPVLAASWSMLRETLLAAGPAGRPVKEAVASAVSLSNTCPYCVEVHSTVLYGLVPGPDATAVGAGDVDAITDSRVREIAAWARALGERAPEDRSHRDRSPGDRVGDEQAPDRAAPARPGVPFPAEQVPTLAGVAVTFHYLNRMVNVFLGESLLPPGVPAGARAGLLRLAGRLLRPATGKDREPGASLGLLPAAALPEDLSWAAADPCVAGALARGAAAIEAAGRRSVPEPVRELVTGRLAEWDGRPVGASRAWSDEAASSLPAAQRPAGRLALLTAMASYQIGPAVVGDFRRARPGDEALVELTSWASMAAARRVAGRVRDRLARGVT